MTIQNSHDNPDQLFSHEHWLRGVHRLEKRRLTLTAAAIPSGLKSLLDVGTGDGRLASAIKALHPDIAICGADLSRAGLALSPFPGVVARAQLLPFGDKSFDAITCCEVLEHLTTDGVAKAVRELGRVARRLVVVTVPYREQLCRNRAYCSRCSARYHVFGHLQSFDEQRLESLFAEIGAVSISLIAPNRDLFYSRILLWIKQEVFGSWSYAMDATCPHCGEPGTKLARSHLARIFLGGLNLLISFRRRIGGWAFVVVELYDGMADELVP